MGGSLSLVPWLPPWCLANLGNLGCSVESLVTHHRVFLICHPCFLSVLGQGGCLAIVFLP